MSAANISCAVFLSPLRLIKYRRGYRCKLSHRCEDAALMLDEQRQLIELLKANLHRLLKWQFGPKSEHLNVDQLGLFVDGSVVPV